MMSRALSIVACKSRLITLALLWPVTGCATMSLSEAIEPQQIFTRGSLASIERVEWANRTVDDGLLVCVVALTVGKGDTISDSKRFIIRIDESEIEQNDKTAPEATLPRRLEVPSKAITKGCERPRTGKQLAVERVTIGDIGTADSDNWPGWDAAILDHRSAGRTTETLYDVRTVSTGGLIYYDPGAAPDGLDRLYRIVPIRARTEPKPALKVLYPVTVVVDVITSPLQYLALVSLVTIGELPPS